MSRVLRETKMPLREHVEIQYAKGISQFSYAKAMVEQKMWQCFCQRHVRRIFCILGRADAANGRQPECRHVGYRFRYRFRRDRIDSGCDPFPLLSLFCLSQARLPSFSQKESFQGTGI